MIVDFPRSVSSTSSKTPAAAKEATTAAHDRAVVSNFFGGGLGLVDAVTQAAPGALYWAAALHGFGAGANLVSAMRADNQEVRGVYLRAAGTLALEAGACAAAEASGLKYLNLAVSGAQLLVAAYHHKALRDR